MINGIRPLPPQKNYDEALNNLLSGINENFRNWGHGRDRDMVLEIRPGRKFDKIVERNRVWGFVAKKDGVHKGLPMTLSISSKKSSMSFCISFKIEFIIYFLYLIQ